jgi:hypothetical protein
MDELKRIIATWNHERDRAVYRYPDGREQVLYDSGCVKCRRCQVEEWIRKQEATP